MNTKKHKVLDHPILGYFLLIFAGLVAKNIGSVIDTAVGGLIPGFLSVGVVGGKEVSSGAGLFVALACLLVLLLFQWWFRPECKGVLRVAFLKEGLLMLLPVLLIHYVGSIVSICTFGAGSVIVAFFRALSPGFSEEINFRGMGVANFMRVTKDENKIPVILWLSSIVFGGIHILNAFGAATLSVSLLQSLYAIGMGLAFGAVYLRTGNLWPSIIGHFTVDFMEFIRADLNASGGYMIGLGIGDWITTVAGVVAVVFALKYCSKKHYPEIMKVWEERWSGGKA